MNTISIWQVVCLLSQMFPFPGNPPTAVTYTGPGDISANATAWWGLRAYSAAQRGTKAANVCIPVDVACADLSTDAITGKLVISTIGGSSCAVVTCTIKTLYDQTTGGNCTGTCDLTQATIATRPVLTLNCVGTLPCMTFTRASTTSMVSAAYGSTPAQPISASAVGERTATFTSFADMTSGRSGGSVQLGFGNSANTALLFAGTVQTATANDSTPHAVQGLYSGVASKLYIDGSSTTLSAGTNGLGGGDGLSIGSGNNALDGFVCEAGWWISDTSANFSAMNSNQRSFWGF